MTTSFPDSFNRSKPAAIPTDLPFFPDQAAGRKSKTPQPAAISSWRSAVPCEEPEIGLFDFQRQTGFATNSRKAVTITFPSCSSSTTDWTEPEFSNWLDFQILNAEFVQDGKKWWSQPQSSSAQHSKTKSLYRASSYPYQPQPQQQCMSEPVLVPKLSFTYYSPLVGQFEASPHQQNMTSHSRGPRLPFSASNLSPFSPSQLHLGGFHGLPYAENIAEFQTPGIPINSRPLHPWLNQASFLSGNSILLPGFLHHQLLNSNCLMTSQLFPHQRPQQRSLHLKSSLAQFSRFHSPHFSSHLSSNMANNFDVILGATDLNEYKSKALHKRRQNMRSSQQSFDSGIGSSGSGSFQFRSKCMSSEEIESILRMQHAATHRNDPYLDDYYHQACLAKKSTGSRLKNQFCPSFIRDLSSVTRSNNDSHAYLQIDALGRISFSSIRRPRPLLEVPHPLPIIKPPNVNLR
ncbi:hypothetical protein KSP40_PGU004336 [Platanthera guangdongensis]|uniref:Uncharacterized protein n=1 Tax=Platanthera guangdongensis TaxID=2320717 RepID=A0ABR2MX08_9ASPA